MLTNSDRSWGVRLATLVLWALAGASVVYWGLRLSAPAPGLPLAAVATGLPAPDAQAMARLLGAVTLPAPVVPVAALASRFVLVGVLAGQTSGGGAALIAVDGQPAKPYRVGTVVDAGLVLQALGPRQARLGAAVRGPSAVTLELPARP